MGDGGYVGDKSTRESMKEGSTRKVAEQSDPSGKRRETGVEE